MTLSMFPHNAAESRRQSRGTAFGGGVVELAKTRRVQFLRDAHSSDQSSET